MTYSIDKTIAKTILTLALGFSLLSLPSMASAAIIFSQGFNPSSFTGNGSSDFGSNNQKADNFTVQQDSILGSVSWLGLYHGGATPSADNFTLRLFQSNASNLPNTTFFWSENVSNLITRTATPSTTFAGLFTYEATLSAGVSLTAGTTYWLSIVNNVGTSNLNDWGWAASSLTGSAASRSFDTESWVNSNGTYQFQLTSVPVPGAIWFLGSGLLGLVFSKRKRAMN